jgi:biotin carboxylase
MAMRKIIIVGSQDEIFEELSSENIELYVIQPAGLIGPRLKAAAAYIYAIEAFNDEQVLAGARYFCEHHAIDALFSFTEYGLLPAANAAKELGLPGISAELTELCRNKWKLREFLAATSFHVPFVMADSHASLTLFSVENGFPLVLKDPSGVGSINVKICSSLADSLSFFDELQRLGYAKVLAEKYVEGTEYSVETLSIRGHHQLIGLTKKYLLSGGLVEQKHVYPAALAPEETAKIERYICRLLEQIQNWHGPLHIEVKVKGQQIYLIEINNRPGGDYIWDMVNKVSGVNLVAETLRYAFDGQPDLHEREVRRRYGAMSYIALIKPILSSTIQSALEKITYLDRVQCKISNRFNEQEVRNSYERPGFILIGEKNIESLNVVLPAIEQWIDAQYQCQGEKI